MENVLRAAALGNFDWEEIEHGILYNIGEQNIIERRNREELYGKLNLNELTDEQVRLYFRFGGEDLPRLAMALGIPYEVRTANRHKVTGIEGLCIYLRRLAYPNRLSDLEPLFGFSAQSLSHICNTIMKIIYENHIYRLHNFESLRWLTQNKLHQYAQVITQRGAPLNNVWAFIDGTARPICRPSVHQEDYYSGHKRHHCVKYQSVVCPDGIVANPSAAYPGRRHDAGIFRDSNLYPQLQEYMVFPNGDEFVLYGDQAYGVRQLLISPFSNRNLTEEQQNFNNRMSSVRQSVEWGFSKIIVEFAFLDFKKNQKLLLQDIHQMYSTAMILTNCHTCLYGSQTAKYFNIDPPNLEEYLGLQLV